MSKNMIIEFITDNQYLSHLEPINFEPKTRIELVLLAYHANVLPLNYFGICKERKTKNPMFSRHRVFHFLNIFIYENNNPMPILFLPPKIEQNIAIPLRLDVVDVETDIFDVNVFICLKFSFVSIKYFKFSNCTMQR